MEDEVTRKLVTFSDGSQALTESAGGLHMTVGVDSADIISEHVIDVTSDQFKDLAEKAKTHSIDFDTISEELKVTPKEEIKSDMQNPTPEENN